MGNLHRSRGQQAIHSERGTVSSPSPTCEVDRAGRICGPGRVSERQHGSGTMLGSPGIHLRHAAEALPTRNSGHSQLGP